MIINIREANYLHVNYVHHHLGQQLIKHTVIGNIIHYEVIQYYLHVCVCVYVCVGLVGCLGGCVGICVCVSDVCVLINTAIAHR